MKPLLHAGATMRQLDTPDLAERFGYVLLYVCMFLSYSGLVVGFAMTLSSMCFFGALLTFFVSASKATKFRASRKKHLEEDFKECK